MRHRTPAWRSVGALLLSLVACATSGRRRWRSARRRRRRGGAPAPVSADPRPARVATLRPQTYTVKRGDTLHAIALDHGLDYRELVAWNNIDNANLIRVGQVLRLPARRSRPGPGRRRCDGAAAAGAGGGGWAGRRRPRRAVGRRGTRNAENYKSQPKAVKDPIPSRRVRDIQRVAAAAPGAGPPAAAPSRAWLRRAACAAARRRRSSPRAPMPTGRRRRTATTRSTGCGRRPARSSPVSPTRESEGHRHRRPAGQPVVASARRQGRLRRQRACAATASSSSSSTTAPTCPRTRTTRRSLVKEGQQVARPEDRRDGQHRQRPGQAALRDPATRQARRSAEVPAAGHEPPARGRPREGEVAARRGRAQRERRTVESTAVAPGTTDQRIAEFAPADDAVQRRAGRRRPRATRARPERDRWTQELPLSEPAPALGATSSTTSPRST